MGQKNRPLVPQETGRDKRTVGQAEGKIVPATVVDHIIPHRGDQKLFWDQANWEPLCKKCHDRKTGSGL